MNISKKGVAQAQEFASAMNRVKDLVEDIPALLDDPSLVEVYTIAAAADARKAQNIKALRVSQLTVVTNFMVILEGTSRPQNQAIAASIIDAMEEQHDRPTKQQGTPDRLEVLFDFFNFFDVILCRYNLLRAAQG
jgi:ribosomal silencing factor RsfS